MNQNMWTPLPMYCPNCGTLGHGYKNEEGKIKYECLHCRVVMVRSYKNRRQDTLEITLPKGVKRYQV